MLSKSTYYDDFHVVLAPIVKGSFFAKRVIFCPTFQKYLLFLPLLGGLSKTGAISDPFWQFLTLFYFSIFYVFFTSAVLLFLVLSINISINNILFLKSAEK
jgi:hypothetical protein